MKKDEDKLLLKQIAKQNRRAFDKLFRKYYQQLVRFAVGYTHDGGEAEEIVQEVMVKLWQQASEIKIEVSVLAYLYTSVRNKALNMLKHEKVKKKYADSQVTRVNMVENSESHANMEVFKDELVRAMANLPDRCREIFELAKFEGLSYDEIATYLEVSAKTVENQLGIAMKKLRLALLPSMSRIYET